LIVTDHTAYDFPTILRHARLVVDTRNATANCEAGDCRVYKA
jgi:UDP-N-acetyl-D-glucosamine dehydrogenase